MDGWPKSWRSLGWISLLSEIPRWALRAVIYQFDPRRKYP